MDKFINDLQLDISDKSDSEFNNGSDNEEFNDKFVNDKSNDESKS